MVEVDVREQDRPWGVVAEGLEQRPVAGLGARVDDHAVHREAADDPLAPEVAHIDLAHGGGPYNPGSS